MTEPLPSFVHNLGKTLNEMLEVSGVLGRTLRVLWPHTDMIGPVSPCAACLCAPPGR